MKPQNAVMYVMPLGAEMLGKNDDGLVFAANDGVDTAEGIDVTVEWETDDA